MPQKKKVVFSGFRPTGPVHLGHLIGALQNWRNLQEKYECYFMVADLHALSSEYEDSKNIKSYGYENVVDWISTGIDPFRATVFIQSHVKAHAELHLILSMIVPLPWLERNPTYKEQMQEIKGKNLSTYGFLGYPVLQAADILLYHASLVPVGQDQLPHLELSREIARRFNHLYRKVFVEPEAVLTQTPKLLGLDNRKMGKSYGNFIALSDPPEMIRQKTQQMVTDPQRIKITDPGHPDICNVFSYYGIFKEEVTGEVRDYCTNARVGCTECKKRLAGFLIDLLSGIQEKRRELLEQPEQIEEILTGGAQKARGVAENTLQKVKEVVGIL